MNPYRVIDAAEEGIPIQFFDALVDESGYSKAATSALIGLDARKLNSFKRLNKNFTKTQAEHLIKLKELFSKGIEVFGSSEEFNRWLSKPSYGLGSRIPEKLLHYISGIDLIERELIRIEYGDFS